MKDIIVIGAGGHGKVIADLVIKTSNCLVGFLDDNASLKTVMGYPVLGPVNHIETYKSTAEFVIGVGNNQIRKCIAEKYNVQWHTLIHPTASIGLDVILGSGTVILANSVINSSVIVGNHCIINTGAIVEHDNILENYVHIAPGAILGGTVLVGERTQIGIGATVKNNISICENSLVGAGAVVVQDIISCGNYIGLPARKL